MVDATVRYATIGTFTTKETLMRLVLVGGFFIYTLLRCFADRSDKKSALQFVSIKSNICHMVQVTI